MGCNATAQFVDGSLLKAAENNDVPMAKHFIKSAKQVNEAGETALIVAAKHGSLDVAKLLAKQEAGIKDNQGKTALMWAGDNVEMVKLLIKHEAGIKDNNGWTALMWAEEKQNKDLLLAHLPAEAGIQDPDGLTALMWSAKTGKDISVKILADYELGKKNTEGKTASELARESGY